MKRLLLMTALIASALVAPERGCAKEIPPLIPPPADGDALHLRRPRRAPPDILLTSRTVHDRVHRPWPERSLGLRTERRRAPRHRRGRHQTPRRSRRRTSSSTSARTRCRTAGSPRRRRPSTSTRRSPTSQFDTGTVRCDCERSDGWLHRRVVRPGRDADPVRRLPGRRPADGRGRPERWHDGSRSTYKARRARRRYVITSTHTCGDPHGTLFFGVEIFTDRQLGGRLHAEGDAVAARRRAPAGWRA